MPSKSLVASGEKHTKNFKKSKNRVTLLGCANASGTCKLPLAFIHKSAKPRCFKHMNMASLLLCTEEILDGCNNIGCVVPFHDKFVPYVKHFCQEHIAS